MRVTHAVCVIILIYQKIFNNLLWYVFPFKTRLFVAEDYCQEVWTSSFLSGSQVVGLKVLVKALGMILLQAFLCSLSLLNALSETSWILIFWEDIGSERNPRVLYSFIFIICWIRGCIQWLLFCLRPLDFPLFSWVFVVPSQTVRLARWSNSFLSFYSCGRRYFKSWIPKPL